MPYLFRITMLALLFTARAWRPAPATRAAEGDYLNATQISSTTAALDWSVAGSGSYSVSAIDLTSNQLLASFATSRNTAEVSGLVTGHTVRFMIGRSSSTIITDLVVCG